MKYGIDEPTQCPTIPDSQLLSILQEEYGIIRARITHLTGYEDCNARLDDIEWEKTFDKKAEHPTSAIVKITNPIESQCKGHIELQHRIYDALTKAGIPSVRLVITSSEALWVRAEIFPGMNLPVRLFHVLPGSNLENFDFTPQLCFDLGALLARVHDVFDSLEITPKQNSHLPFISPQNYECVEREMKVLVAKKLLSWEKLDLVLSVLDDLKETILEHDSFDFGLIHSDFNETNILAERADDGSTKITGVLDFGDVHFSHRVFDISACVLYLHLADRLKQEVATLLSNVLMGYRSVRAFQADHQIMAGIRSRLACSLIYGLRTARLNIRGGSTDYILRTQSNGWSALSELSASLAITRHELPDLRRAV